MSASSACFSPSTGRGGPERPICATHAELRRLLVGIIPQQARYIIENKGKFSAWIAWAHGLCLLDCDKHISKLAYYIVNA